MTHFYFAACAAPEEGGGVYHYVRVGDELVFRDRLPCDRPMYLHLSGQEMRVILRAPYERENSERKRFSALVTCLVDPDGCLGAPGDMVCTRGVVACHLCRFRGNTYAVNYLSGSVFSTSGALEEHVGRGVHPTRQESAHTHFIAPGPNGSDLLCTDLGLDAVYCYDASLNELSVAHVPAGHGARHLAYAGQTVFCANELGNSVTVFAYENHRLEPGETVPVLNHPAKDSTVAAIRVAEDWVYVSNRGDDSISCLHWRNGRLRLCRAVPAGGASPRDFLIMDGWLVVTNEKSDTVTVMKGAADQWQNWGLSLRMPSPLCVVAREQESL